MTAELLYTSAAKGLKAGSRGFCTVVSSSGMPSNLASKLESLSGYRQMFLPSDPNASKNPIAFSHLTFNLGGQPTSVLSRVAAYGADYSGRTNKLAHHVVPSVTEKVAAGPAWLLMQPGVMRTEWDGNCQTTPSGPTLPSGNLTPGMCNAWQRLAGDAGWGGVVADSFRQVRGKPMFVIYSLDHQRDLLQLLTEATALLPPEQRWQATFSTYAAQLPPDVSCQVRFVVEGSQEAQMARARGTVIHLGADNGAVPSSDLVDIARGKSPAPTFTTPSQPAAPVTPATPAAGVAIPSIDAAVNPTASPSLPVTPRSGTPSLPNTPSLPQPGVYDDFKVAPAVPLAGGYGQTPHTAEVGGYEDDWQDPAEQRSQGNLPWILLGLAVAMLLIVGVGVVVLTQTDLLVASNQGNSSSGSEIIEGTDEASIGGPAVQTDELNEPSETGGSNPDESPDMGAEATAESNPEVPHEPTPTKEVTPEDDMPPSKKPTPALKVNGLKVAVTGLDEKTHYQLRIKGENSESCLSFNPDSRVVNINKDGDASAERTFELVCGGYVTMANRITTFELVANSAPEKVIAKYVETRVVNDPKIVRDLKNAFGKNGALKDGQPVTVDLVESGVFSQWKDDWSVDFALLEKSGPFLIGNQSADGFYLTNEQILDVRAEGTRISAVTKTPLWTLSQSGRVKVKLSVKKESGELIFDSGEVDTTPLSLEIGAEGKPNLWAEWDIPSNGNWRMTIPDTLKSLCIHRPYSKGSGTGQKRNHGSAMSNLVFGCDAYPPLQIKDKSFLKAKISIGSLVAEKPLDDYVGTSLVHPPEQAFGSVLSEAFKNLGKPYEKCEAFLEVVSSGKAFGKILDFNPIEAKLITLPAEYVAEDKWRKLQKSGDPTVNWLVPSPPEVSGWKTLGLSLLKTIDTKRSECTVFAITKDFSLPTVSNEGRDIVFTIITNGKSYRYAHGENDTWTSRTDEGKYSIRLSKVGKKLTGFIVTHVIDVGDEMKSKADQWNTHYESLDVEPGNVHDKAFWQKIKRRRNNGHGIKKENWDGKVYLDDFVEVVVAANRAATRGEWLTAPGFSDHHQRLTEQVQATLGTYEHKDFNKNPPGPKPELKDNPSEEDKKKLEFWQKHKAAYEAWTKFRQKTEGSYSKLSDVKEIVGVPAPPVGITVQLEVKMENIGTYEIPQGLTVH